MYDSRSLRDTIRAALPDTPGVVAPTGETLSAVLLPVINGSEPSVVFTKRTDSLPRHAGEISFPGGLQHDEDADLLETALRESEEELGLTRDAVEVLGTLEPLHTFTSGMLIMPFVGWLRERPRFTPNEAEIAEVLEVPVSKLVEVEDEVELVQDEARYFTFVYDVDGHNIWGATARILHEFLEIVTVGRGLPPAEKDV
jgi:8-oxo-dGTP pyrophosphatase MutT (NUDIX family)